MSRGSWETNALAQRHCESGLFDLMLVFPAAGSLDDDDEELPEAGDDLNNPTVNSAPWYMKQFILDDCLFSMEEPEADIVHSVSQLSFCAHVSINPADARLTPLSTSSGRRKNIEENLMAACADKEEDFDEDEDFHDPVIKTAYLQVRSARTMGQLRRTVLDLMLRYLLCRHCGFEVRAFSSVDEDELFVGVSASKTILRAHADQLGYRLQVSSEVAVEMMGGRFKEDEFSPPFMRFDIDEEDRFVEQDSQCRSPFKIFCDTYEEGSIFSSADRIRIITSILTKVFDLQGMCALGLLQCTYPVHNQLDLVSLNKQSWASYSGKHYRSVVSTNRIQTYFGAKVAFRVCFLRFLTRQLAPLAFLAVVMEFLPLGDWAHMTNGLLLMLWSATAEEFWKRKEASKAHHWGMEEFSLHNAPRPQFFGTMGLSRSDRLTQIKFYPPYKHILRKVFTNTLTVLFNVLVIACTLGLYGYHDRLLAAGHHHLALTVNMAIALQIQVFNAFWVWAAERLTNFENHEWQSEYTDALVIRNFSTYAITSFCSVFYIAFVKHFMMGSKASDTNAELAKQLRVLFLINMFLHILSVAFPFFRYRLHLAEERWGSTKETRESAKLNRQSSYNRVDVGDSLPEPSYPEIQAKMPQYSLSEEIYDRMDVWVELGYVLFFGLVAPDVIVLFLVSNFMRLHAMGWRLTYAMRRAQPDGAHGIGTKFMKLFRIMAHVAVASNIVQLLINNAAHTPGEDLFNGLKAFIGKPDNDVARDQDWRLMLGVFWLLERGVCFVRWAIDEAIPDIPEKVELQKARRQAVLQEISQRVDSHLKVWEGQELERAYSLKPIGQNRVLVLTSGCSWALASAPSVAAGHTPVPPFTSADPDFEWPSFTSQETVGFHNSEGRSPRMSEQARRLVYAV